MVETQSDKQERALLVGLVTAKQNLQKMQENLDELFTISNMIEM